MKDKISANLSRISCGGFYRIKADEVSCDRIIGNNGITVPSHDKPVPSSLSLFLFFSHVASEAMCVFFLCMFVWVRLRMSECLLTAQLHTQTHTQMELIHRETPASYIALSVFSVFITWSQADDGASRLMRSGNKKPCGLFLISEAAGCVRCERETWQDKYFKTPKCAPYSRI